MRILRWVVDCTTILVGKIKKQQRVKLPANESSITKLNLGCGLAVAPNWVNVDGSFNALVATLPKFTHKIAYRLSGARKYYSEFEYCELLDNNAFVHHDLSLGLPFFDQIADFIYTSHFIEHLFKKDAEHLLTESYRVLKAGGTIRVAIPDLEYAVSLYYKGNKDEMLANFFFIEDDSFYARHKYMYDFEMMKNILEKIGFTHVNRKAYRVGDCPDLVLLDNRPDESLFVEARK